MALEANVLNEVNERKAKTNFVVETDDSFAIFGKYIASELRSIENVRIAKRIQRQLNRTLLNCLDGINAL